TILICFWLVSICNGLQILVIYLEFCFGEATLQNTATTTLQQSNIAAAARDILIVGAARDILIRFSSSIAATSQVFINIYINDQIENRIFSEMITIGMICFINIDYSFLRL
ncbi:hypothetical protein ACJX0J_036935, partial [Zea mays]